MQQFDFIAALIDKNKHIVIIRIPAKDILHKSTQAVDPVDSGFLMSVDWLYKWNRFSDDKANMG